MIRSGVHLPGADSALRTGAPGARSSLGVDSDALVIGMVARFADQKDHGTALRAFAALIADHPRAVLVFVGDGPTRPGAERLATELDLGGRVVFAGHRSDAAELAAAFDIGLLTSHWEGVPRSLVESAAAAVPLVASDVGGVADIVVEGNTGFLVPVGDVPATTERLRRLLDDPGLRTEMGVAAAVQAEMFSVDRMRVDLQDLWRTVAVERATSRTVTPGP